MKVLQIEWLGTIGGLERYVSNLSLDLQNKGHDVEVCVLNNEGTFTDELKKKNIRINCIGMKSGFDLLGLLRFKNFLKNNNYDIVHVHERTILANILLWIYCKSPKVFTDHGGELIGDKPWKRKYFYKFLSSQYSRIIANSNYVKQRISTYIGSDKLITIYNGINLTKFSSNFDKEHEKSKLNLRANKCVVGIIARIIPTKGIDLFIETAKEIASVSKNFIFLIIGDGPYRNEYEEMAMKVRNEFNILFLGARPDIENILPVFDIFLFTSRWEAFGLVLLEAMAAGIPIAGFDIPGANEVVENGRTAVLVKPFDVKQLTCAVLELTDNRRLYKSLSLAGQNRVRKYFTIDHNTSNILELYHNISSNS